MDLSTASFFEELENKIEGEIYYRDNSSHNAMRLVYATDASVYQEKPLAVTIPKTEEDIKTITRFARSNGYTIIPRAAGTSLAGQVVGNGIILDISKYFTAVLQVNKEESWVRVQPGVIRDDLNVFLQSYGLMFGPETSTSNRAMIGGMIGNNSCGLHSIIWGDTRDNLLEVRALLEDGSEAVFKELNKQEYTEKLALATTEGAIYRRLHGLIGDEMAQTAIKENFPNPLIKRRNTGYALDFILNMFGKETFNLCSLVAGSEGTLCIVLEAKLKLMPLPPKEKGIVAIHTGTIKEALLANLVALRHGCAASELVDDIILEFTKTNIDQSKNRVFVEGNPRAILMVEFFDETGSGLAAKAKNLVDDLVKNNLGYAYPLLVGTDCLKAWDLRKAGLGLLRNEPGNTQPVNLIEDCAVTPQDLPAYIDEIENLLQHHNIRYSMYAHAGAGELHVEPMINLKTTEGKQLFRTILSQTTEVLKRYNGSLSGEHGDGRLRGEFIPFMMGEKVYQLFREVKEIFDPRGVFNKGKIVDTPAMNEYLRYQQDEAPAPIHTVFDFRRQESILHLAEKCSGSGDCRKTSVSGGTMCPSYMATRSERDTTRARANMLRHFYTKAKTSKLAKKDYEEVKEVLDLCLSCKGCKSECPSSVDVGKMKAEFTQQYHNQYGASFRSKLIGSFSDGMKLAANMPFLYNAIFRTPATRRLVNRFVGFHPERSMPLLHNTTLRQWYEKRKKNNTTKAHRVYLFCDEFTNYNDVPVGHKLILLLEALGYEVIIPEHIESGRSYLSKGFVKKAKEIACRNVALLKNIITPDTPLIGIEPSAILSFRDEYPELVEPHQQGEATSLARNSFLFEEWFSREIEAGRIEQKSFTDAHRLIQVHGHCHQKAIASVSATLKCLSYPRNYIAHEIPSGCCGMAGSFGYEKEHYEVSMQIGELVLFPAIRKCKEGVAIAASGTSCRHQVKDGTGKVAKHPAELLYEALVK